MSLQKKCPNCGNWSEVDDLQKSQNCTHCNSILFQPINKVLEDNTKTEKDFFIIKPTDKFLMKTVRKASWVAHLIFGIVMAILIWILILIAH